MPRCQSSSGGRGSCRPVPSLFRLWLAGRLALHKLLILTLLVLSGTAYATDIVYTKSGLINTGQVLRVEADGIYMRLAVGELKVFKADISRVEIEKPAAYEAALAALKARNFEKAAADLKPLVERYAGLSVPWVQDAMLQLGDAYLSLHDFAAGKRTFDDFARSYPDAAKAAGLDVKYARVLYEQKEYAKAEAALKSFIEPLVKSPVLSDEQEAALAAALVLRGDCQRAAGASEDALDSYLMVVTLFNDDPSRAAEAKYKAAQVFEQLGNWKRAKGGYEELVKEATDPGFTADARKRLAALTAAHPE
jgi:TolA-binding protein